MFRIQAPYGEGARAIEQPDLSAMHLNSGDSFTVFSSSTTYTWQGEGSNQKEVELAKKLESFLDFNQAKSELKEGGEPEEFWSLLGGKQSYVKVRDHGIVNNDFESCLFWVSNSSGFMYMKPVPAFTQQCLLTDDVYILDCYNEIYIWVGTLSNKFEKNGAYSRSAKYIEALKDGRNKDTIMMVEVQPMQEPPLFKVQFPVWDDNYSKRWVDTEPFKQLKEQHKTAPIDENPFKGLLDPATNKFPYSELKGKFPEGVKGDRKEAYLSDQEFTEVFKMSRTDYVNLKLWKQQELKKKVGLF